MKAWACQARPRTTAMPSQACLPTSQPAEGSQPGQAATPASQGQAQAPRFSLGHSQKSSLGGLAQGLTAKIQKIYKK